MQGISFKKEIFIKNSFSKVFPSRLKFLLLYIMATFNNQAVKGIKRIGDVFLPGNQEFPSYSKAGGTYKLKDMTQYAPEEDIEALNIVLMIFSITPMFILRILVKFPYYFTSIRFRSERFTLLNLLRRIYKS